MMNILPNNPADLVAHAAFFESKGSYSLANKLLNELKTYLIIFHQRSCPWGVQKTYILSKPKANT